MRFSKHRWLARPVSSPSRRALCGARNRGTGGRGSGADHAGGRRRRRAASDDSRRTQRVGAGAGPRRYRLERSPEMPAPALEALIRAAAMAAVFFAFRIAYRRLRGREGMGLGDVKLAGVAGIWLDWLSLPIAVEIAALGALVFLAWLRIRTRRATDPLGKLPLELSSPRRSGYAGSWSGGGTGPYQRRFAARRQRTGNPVRIMPQQRIEKIEARQAAFRTLDG